MTRLFLFITALFILSANAQSRTLAKIEVKHDAEEKTEAPISIPLDGINYNQDEGQLCIFEIVDGEKVGIPCQLETQSARLWWILSAKPDTSSRWFEMAFCDSTPVATPFFITRDEKKCLIQKNELKVLQYNQAVVYPPEGVDQIFKRSAFIHPLWAPDGTRLTNIQPKDHYHHYGIWAPWTKTLFEGRHVDFWNLGEGQGTVEFVGFVSMSNGPVYCGFRALHNHIDFTAKGAGKVALNEVWDVRVWNVGKETDAFLLDISITLSCASESPILMEAYRYGGGIGFRATEKWTKENVQVLTSEGKQRDRADGSKARWCNVSGSGKNGRAGIVFHSHIANRRHPEPMRVWPSNANGGRGDLFFEFCPIRHHSWTLVPGQPVNLKYRLYVYNDTISSDIAEQLWQDFSNSPEIIVTKLDE